MGKAAQKRNWRNAVRWRGSFMGNDNASRNLNEINGAVSVNGRQIADWNGAGARIDNLAECL